MNTATFLALPLAFGLQVLGAALPDLSTHNVLSISHGNATTSGDEKLLNRRFQSTFVATPGDSQMLCTLGDYADMNGQFARAADCRAVGNELSFGYYDMTGWDTTIAQSIIVMGTCAFRVSRSDGQDTEVRIGDWDVFNLVGKANAGFQHGGLLAVMGDMNCVGVDIIWSLSEL